MAKTGQAFGSVNQSLDASVIVVGAGFSGIAMAIALQKKGIDYLILEKGDDFGGTWRDNVYPGAACDVPSHMYSFSFEPNRWDYAYSRQPEIFDYQKKVARKHGLYEHVRFNSEVASAHYQDQDMIWNIKTAQGETFKSRILISAKGPLHLPNFPKIDGLNEFAGTKMHSAQWDDSIDLTGKTVAVVGTGASAIQIVPELAKVAGHLLVFQRTPAWVLPKPDFKYRETTKNQFEKNPLARLAHRAMLYWRNEVMATGFIISPRLMKLVEYLAKYNLRQVKNKKTRQQLTPNYTIGCKRILISNNFYQTFNQPNVQLVHGAVESMDKTGICAKDTHFKADVVVFCTGFDVTETTATADIVGRNGVSMSEHWRNGMFAYKGSATHDFPNAFFILGPNTGLGHNSMIFMIESQVNYVIQALSYMRKKSLMEIEVKKDIELAFNQGLQKDLRGTVWSSGCASWYLDANGRNTTLWPGFTFIYWMRTRTFDPNAYMARKVAGAAAPYQRVRKIIAKA